MKSMEFDPKYLEAAIAAEIIRRDWAQTEHDATVNGPEPSGRRITDIVRAFEPVDLEGLLPQPADASPPPAAPSSADARAASLYLKLRRTSLGRVLDHPRVIGLLQRARQRPGGATLRNVFAVLAHSVFRRVPLLAAVYRRIAPGRHLSARIAALEAQLAESNTTLRNVGLLIQDQVNQAVYTHAVAAQSNDTYLFRLTRQLEQQLREMATSRPGVPAAVPSRQSPAADDLPPDLYGAFEERFRGARPLIRERLRANLPRFTPLFGRQAKPVLDLGCGRGEWLQLLAEHDIPAEGVDSSPWMVRACTDAGLNARQGDAIEYLASLPDNALAGLTGFHIIEHLPIGVLLRLIQQARRVVEPGGVVLFETPNPENLIVGACNFYLDPTHRNPLPPALVAFLLEENGFERVEIERRHPADPARLAAGDLAQPLATLLFGPQDYAAIGYVPPKDPQCI